MNPETDEQIRRQTDEFPKNEEQKQTIRNDDTHHRGRKERNVREEPRKISVVGHVADAKDKDTKPDERDHHQHRGSKRVENKSDPQCLFAKFEPGEVLNSPEPGPLQCLHKSQ